MGRFRSALPLAVVCALSLAALAGQTFWAWQATGGANLYPLDDTYIHLAMARELLNGNWGLEPGRFANASSSPLYPVLLALGHSLGLAWEWVPLAVNALATIGLLAIADWLFRRRGFSDPWRWAGLGLLAFVPPLPFIAQTGMEHLAHCALCTIVLALLIEETAGRWRWLLVPLAALLTITRLESFSLIGLACLWCAWRRQWLLGIAMGLAALAPWAWFGPWSRSHGGEWLPNPVLLKGSAGLSDPFIHLAASFYGSPGLLVPLLALIVASARELRHNRHSLTGWLCAGIAAQLLAHGTLASFGWLHRYEAYLLVLSVLAAIVWAQSRPRVSYWTLALAAFLLVRAATYYPFLFGAIEEINAQQVRTARFLAANYAGAHVAVNDIGAVALYGGIHLTDLAGLASTQVARMRLAGQFTEADLERLAQQENLDVIAIYDGLFTGRGDVRRWYNGPAVPKSWIRVGEWRLNREPIVVAGRSVAFYAPTRERAEKLRQRLEAYEARQDRLSAGLITLRLSPWDQAGSH